MMEVKQNVVDLKDLLTSSKNTGVDEVDDAAVMTDLSDRSAHALVNCDLIKTNDETSSIPELENGDADMTSIIGNVDVGVDLNTNVNSELEDALLAEDDVLPVTTNEKAIQPSSSATEDILAEKTETSNSTTSSNNVRDPGDDLDTLLSKINDIVEDCIDNESENIMSNTIKSSGQTNNKVEETEKETDLKECALETIEANVTDESNLVVNEITHTVNTNKEDELSEQAENVSDRDISVASNLAETLPKHANSEEDTEADTENNKCDDQNNASADETNINDDTESIQLNSVDNKSGNLDLKKTDEPIEEVVQDNEITSNSSEVLEDSKIIHDETLPDSKELNNEEINKTTENNEEPLENLGIVSISTNEKTPNEDAITPGNGENDDSDDEIVFYVDKPPEIKTSKETVEKSVDTEKQIEPMTKSMVSEIEMTSSPAKKAQVDDDVVLLLDDDEEEAEKRKEESFKKEVFSKDQGGQNESEVPSFAPEEKGIVTDNSDNARDDFLNENSSENKKLVDKAEVCETPEETNSNCSSSSNLLQEAKSVKNGVDEVAPDEAENEEEEDDGDVELIESELKDSEILEKTEDSEISPPAKRIRLSEDGEQSKKEESGDGFEETEILSIVEKKQESQENSEKDNSAAITSRLKRSHDVVEIEADDKSNDSKASNEGINKKLKIDISKDDMVLSEKVEEIKDLEDLTYVDDDKKSIKAVPSYEPIRLYPAPNFETLKSELPMSLDFLKKFRKSFDNMTKQDLEELVLQKVVEAIIHRSEFSEMRELIEKQEKLISAHRSKISELSKQFRDLEMVHNRVVKDIEQRNAQFIMPVKITRAVGLQVYIPNKKTLSETTSSPTGPTVPSSPQRPVSSQASSIVTNSLTSSQRQFLSSQTDTQQQRSTATASSVPGNTSNVRRGCVQKITPIRPVPGSNQSSSSGPSTVVSAAYRSTPNHSAVTQPRILNKNATTPTNTTAIQRSRYLSSSQENQRMSTQQITRAPNVPSNSQRVVANAATQSKPTSNIVTTVPRRSEPLSSQTANSSIVDNYINTLTHLSGGSTAVSITPAKPKEKAVIDLTDEDETPTQSAGAQTVSQMTGTTSTRRILPTTGSTNTQLQYGRAAPSLARVPPVNQMANNKSRQMSSLQGQKNSSFTAINTPPGTSITRINVASNASNVQRVKYSHPAPLPATPPQAFNPSWKLPPPRPTIRISNLDNGIVISWTMEESMDRHAECISYQIYAYQETSGPPMVDSWRHVGDVKAMLLPMAVTLTQFQEGQRYYFAVRAVDCHQRYGPFSLPKTWS